MAIQKVHVRKINFTDTTRDGKKITSKFGKPVWKVGMQTNEHEGWINGFLPFQPDKWEGTDQQVDIYDDPKWGKSFKLPPREPKGGMTEEQWGLLNRKLDTILTEIKLIRGSGKSWTPTVADMDFTPVEDTREVPDENYETDAP